MRLTLPAVAASVPEARHAVASLARELGAAGRVVADVELAVSEACTNVVMHAYREHAAPGAMTVVAEAREGALAVTVADEGGAQATGGESPGLGMGMALMAALASGIQIDQDDGATRVHLSFELHPATPPPEVDEQAAAAARAEAERPDRA